MGNTPNRFTPAGTLCRLVRDKPIGIGRQQTLANEQGYLWRFMRSSVFEDVLLYGCFQSVSTGRIFEDLYYDRFEVLEAQEDKEGN